MLFTRNYKRIFAKPTSRNNTMVFKVLPTRSASRLFGKCTKRVNLHTPEKRGPISTFTIVLRYSSSKKKKKTQWSYCAFTVSRVVAHRRARGCKAIVTISRKRGEKYRNSSATPRRRREGVLASTILGRYSFRQWLPRSIEIALRHHAKHPIGGAIHGWFIYECSGPRRNFSTSISS